MSIVYAFCAKNSSHFLLFCEPRISLGSNALIEDAYIVNPFMKYPLFVDIFRGNNTDQALNVL